MKLTPIQDARQGAAALAEGLNAAIARARLFGERVVYVPFEEAESMQQTAAAVCATLVELDAPKP